MILKTQKYFMVASVFVYARIEKNNPLISTPFIDTISATVYFKEL